MKSASKFLAAAGVLPCLLGAGENMFYNSSFEMGMDGWNHGQTSYTYPYDKNTPPPRQLVEAKDAPHGKYVMQVTCDKRLYSHDRKMTHAWLINSPDVVLIPGKTYTLSFDIKASKSNSIFLSMHSNHYEVWRSASGSLSTYVHGGKWEHVEKTFVCKALPGKYADPGYRNSFLLFLAPQDGSSYQFDRMQLVEGKASPYQPAGDVEMKMTTPDLYLEKPEVEVALSAFSYEKGGKVTRELILADTGKDQVLQKKTVTFDLTPGKLQTQKIKFDKLPYGAFRIYAAKEPQPVAVDFVRIRPNNSVYKKGTFSVGGRSGALGTFYSPYNKGTDMAYKVGLYTRDEGELLRLSGCLVAGFSDGTLLGGLLPNKRGEYDWLHYDLFFNHLRKLKLKAMAQIPSQAIMTRSGEREWGKAVPDWLRKLDRNGHPEGTYQGGWGHVRVIMPPPEVIAEIAADICKRYKDDICLFRLFGEANGYIKAHQLVEYAKPVYTEIKKAAPGVWVNTINPTEDGGVKMGGYFSEFLQGGGTKYTDLVTFHPYQSSQDDSAMSAMDNIQAFYDAMDKVGVRFPLANTECFYLISNPYNGNPEYTWSLCHPAAYARRFLIDMGEGLCLSMPVALDHLHQAIAANREHSRCYFTNVPNASFAVHNAMAYLLNGAVKPNRVKLPGYELCYTFENHGKKYSAVWCVSGRSQMEMTLPPGVKCKLYDIYGNVMSTAEKSLKLTLDRIPQIIEWSGNADVNKLHKNAQYAPQHFARIYGVKEAAGGVLVQLSNRTAKPVSGFLRLNTEYLESKRTLFKDLKPYEYVSIFIPAKVKANAPAEFELSVVCGANGKIVSTPLKFKHVPTVRLNRVYNLGPHHFKLEKKGEKLVFTGFLSSDKPKEPEMANAPWTGDSVELFFDFTPGVFNPSNPAGYHDDCVQLVIPAAKSGSPAAVSPRNFKNHKLDNVRVERVDGGAKVTASAPYRKGMRFNVHFDAEGKNRVFSGKMNFKDRSGFAVVEE